MGKKEQKKKNNRNNKNARRRRTTALRPRFFSTLSDDLKLSVSGGVGHLSSYRLAQVSREFRVMVTMARKLEMYGGQGLAISAGVRHTVFCNMGRLYTCGGTDDATDPSIPGNQEGVWNIQENNFLGLNPNPEDNSSSEVKRSYLGHGEGVNEHVPRLVEALVGVNIVGVAAGDEHTVVWTDEGKVYSFGLGRCWRLGHGIEENELLPRQIEGVLVGERVVGVSAASHHTVLWTEEGKVYAFGTSASVNGFGVHGREENIQRTPRLIEGALVETRVVGVATGAYHTVVYTDEGKVYAFGLGTSGRLGHGVEDNEVMPRLIEGVLVGKRVVGVTAGNGHTVVWTDKGEAYSFGAGKLGALGYVNEDGRPQPRQLSPRLIEGALQGKRVLGVVAGKLHTVVWTDEGNAYTFGVAKHGRLGHGNEHEREFFPRMLGGALQGKRVVGASAGEFHTVVWTDAGQVYSFGNGHFGQLGHLCGDPFPSAEFMPRLIEARVLDGPGPIAT